jgi:NAD(P)-dependent dehydrogenase (short-subunit alcohol dehydrogenase family)
MEEIQVLETRTEGVFSQAPQGKLAGQVALVTGGCRGIGGAIALALSEEGAHVAINCRTGLQCQEAQKLLSWIREHGGFASVWQADVSVREQVNHMKEVLLKDLKKVDILVNNAGITRDKTFAEMELQMWDQVLAVNLKGVFNCTRAFIDAMIERQYGRIVNITSIVGETGHCGQANYAAAEAGIIAITKTLAKELARKGITVNAIAPGFVETDMLTAIPADVREKILAQIPMGRFGQSEEVARLVRFLVTEGEYITGQVIALNGGLYV